MNKKNIGRRFCHNNYEV